MTTALANKQGQLAPLKAADPKEVLDRILKEESTKDIAASYGVTRSALNYWLIEHCDAEWKSAQVIRAMKRKEDAEDELDNAQDVITISRARERLRAAQWDLERVCRRIYGQDAPPAANAVQINISLRAGEQDAGTEQTQGQVKDRATLIVHPRERDVQSQHYDSGAPQHKPITPGLSVDKNTK